MVHWKITKDVWRIFNPKEKKKFVFLIFLQLLVATLELLSLASLIPLLEILFKGDLLKDETSFFNFSDKIYLIFFIVFAIFVIKNLIIVLIGYFAIKFRNSVSIRLVNDIFKDYLNKNHSFFVQNHSSLLIRNIQEVNNIEAILTRITNFYSDSILFFLILLTAFYLNYQITLIVIIFSISFFIIYNYFTGSRLSNYGELYLKYNSIFLKNLIESLKLHKEILLNNCQDFFVKRNYNYKFNAMRNRLKFSMFEFAPRYIIETFLILIGLITSYYLLIIKNISPLSFLPAASVIIITTLKVMPNALRLFSSLQNFKYMRAQINLISSTINNVGNNSYDNNLNIDQSLEFEKSFSGKNIHFSFDKNKIFKDLSFNFIKNKVVGIYGPSGSGKSTFLNLISGLIYPQSGIFELDGKEIKLNNLNWMSKVGYVPQSTLIMDMSLRENIAFGLTEDKIDQIKLEECIKDCQLLELVNSLDKGLDTIVGEQGSKLSGGQIQRIGIARSLYFNPKILILDESTNSLDKLSEKKIIVTLNRLRTKITILVVSHDLEMLKFCDDIYKLNNQKLVKM